MRYTSDGRCRLYTPEEQLQIAEFAYEFGVKQAAQEFGAATRTVERYLMKYRNGYPFRGVGRPDHDQEFVYQRIKRLKAQIANWKYNINRAQQELDDLYHL